ncbi:hypothetical protein RUND412_000195 [Rhizina undulata]
MPPFPLTHKLFLSLSPSLDALLTLNFVLRIELHVLTIPQDTLLSTSPLKTQNGKENHIHCLVQGLPRFYSERTRNMDVEGRIDGGGRSDAVETWDLDWTSCPSSWFSTTSFFEGERLTWGRTFRKRAGKEGGVRRMWPQKDWEAKGLFKDGLWYQYDKDQIVTISRKGVQTVDRERPVVRNEKLKLKPRRTNQEIQQETQMLIDAAKVEMKHNNLWKQIAVTWNTTEEVVWDEGIVVREHRNGIDVRPKFTAIKSTVPEAVKNKVLGKKAPRRRRFC